MPNDSFQNRIQKNNRYYEKFSSNVAARTEKRNYEQWMERFLSQIPQGGTILDIGCGTGIHMRTFSDRGYRVTGIEPSPAMRNLACEDGLLVLEGSFETLHTLNLRKVSGIWCAASLLHVPQEDLPGVLNQLYTMLEDNGSLFITVRIGSGAKWDRYDETDGVTERFIQLYEEDFLLQAVASAGFAIVHSVVEQSDWGRPSLWLSFVAVRK